MVDWVAHKKHRDQIIADQGWYIGMLDENGEPFSWGMPPIVEMNAPETRHEPSSLSMTLRLKDRNGVLHPAANDLIAEGLDVDDEGALVPVLDRTRMVVIEIPGGKPESRRAFKVVSSTPQGEAEPAVMPLDGTDVLDMLNGIPAPSITSSWTGQWIQADRDWAVQWSKTREIQDLRLSSVADGFTDSGPAEATIRTLIINSLNAAFRAINVTDPPIVVDRRATGRPSPRVMIRKTDDYIWPTISAHAAAAGVVVSARLWLPGDTWSPYGVAVARPTVVIFVEQH